MLAVVEAQKQRCIEGKGKYKKRLPAVKSDGRRRKVEGSSSLFPQCNALRYQCHLGWKRLHCHCHHQSSTFSPRKASAIFTLEPQRYLQYFQDPSQIHAGRPAFKPYGGLLLSACICSYPSPLILQSAVSGHMLTAACSRRTMAHQPSLHGEAVRGTT
jgi:hypothetical protein